MLTACVDLASPEKLAVCPGDPACDLGVGLVGHWRFDEGEGGVAADSSPSGNNAALVNGPAWSKGGAQTGQRPNPFSITLDGVDDHVAVPDPANESLDFGTGSFTCALWLNNPVTTSAFDFALWKAGHAASSPGYDFELGSGGWNFNVADGTTLVGASFSPSPILGRWVHLVGVRDAEAGTLLTYVDGVLKTVKPQSLRSVSNAQPLRMGMGFSPMYFLKGQLDDVR